MLSLRQIICDILALSLMKIKNVQIIFQGSVHLEFCRCCIWKSMKQIPCFNKTSVMCMPRCGSVHSCSADWCKNVCSHRKMWGNREELNTIMVGWCNMDTMKTATEWWEIASVRSDESIMKAATTKIYFLPQINNKCWPCITQWKPQEVRAYISFHHCSSYVQPLLFHACIRKGITRCYLQKPLHF